MRVCVCVCVCVCLCEEVHVDRDRGATLRLGEAPLVRVSE